MDTLKLLQQHWKPIHYKHLIHCLTYCRSYFEDSFTYQGMRDNCIILDGEYFCQDQIIALLATYYDDIGNNYQTSFGDTLYLFFTDLVEDDVDILTAIETEVE